ncbi:GNAT family N-acetyltransferase [Flexibacterium corallicola]|uniref:GNAT family N-acetyltransferase n=1 Tax=Flexibacterium corallicola TaxID=3037259 RepID=UPI00286F8B53|nr:GNAT family N-acetyltransferase [Pseudovibrio sp. M1P-2-3]
MTLNFNPEDITISAYEPADLFEVSELYMQVARKTFPHDPSDPVHSGSFIQITRGEDVWIMKHKGKIIGFIGYQVPNRFLHSLYLDYTYHGAGLGRKMIEFLIGTYGSGHTLKVVKTNRDALKFYRHLGYTDITSPLDAQQNWLLMSSP